MNQYIAVSTFHPGVDMKEVMKVVEAEKAKVKELQQAGSLGEIKLATPQGKVFLDVFAEDEQRAITIVRQLPMAKWWEIEIYTIAGKA